MSQTSPASFGEISRREKARIFAASIIRTTAGIIFIWLCLAIVPETPATKGFIPILFIIIGVTVYIWFFRRQLRDIRSARYPTLRSIEALILVAMMFLAIFAAIYVMVSAADASSFTEPLDHFTAYYFALTVLATVGFGDITPVSDLARIFCMIQMAIDIAFIGVLVKVLGGAARAGLASRQSAQGDGEGTTNG